MIVTREEKEKKLREILSAASIYDLRVIGRREGVFDSTTLKKEDLVQGIIDVLLGTIKPNLRKKAGAPAKNNSVDPKIDDALQNILCDWDEGTSMKVQENIDDEVFDENFVVFRESAIHKGILEILSSGYGFVRSQACLIPEASGDVYVSAAQIHALHLREGDEIVCKAGKNDKSDSAALTKLISVNNIPEGFYENRGVFDALSVRYPNYKIRLTRYSSDLTVRILDLFVPVGRGQRVLVAAPPHAGKTTLLKKIAAAMNQYESIETFALVLDAHPEEIADFEHGAGRTHVVATTFDQTPAHHIRAARIILEHAKRLCESGRHALILVDSLTKLAWAYGHAERNSERPDFAEIKKFFGTARNTAGGGSVTIIGAVSTDTKDPTDDKIYEELKKICNSEIYLRKILSLRRYFPLIDFERSRTENDEDLLEAEEADAVSEIRKAGIGDIPVALLEEFSRTRDNDVFIDHLSDILQKLSQ